jgi:hypothetical protein
LRLALILGARYRLLFYIDQPRLYCRALIRHQTAPLQQRLCSTKCCVRGILRLQALRLSTLPHYLLGVCALIPQLDVSFWSPPRGLLVKIASGSQPTRYNLRPRPLRPSAALAQLHRELEEFEENPRSPSPTQPSDLTEDELRPPSPSPLPIEPSFHTAADDTSPSSPLLSSSPLSISATPQATPFIVPLPSIVPTPIQVAILPTLAPIAQMSQPSMPARGDRNAPQFDKTQPRELRRYFDNLEFLFGRAQVADDKEKNCHARRFVDVDTADLWESIPEFMDPAKTYEHYKTAIFRLYPGSEDERKWSVTDLENLTTERAQIGIHSLGDLGDYHRQFLAMTAFLLNKGRLSVDDQNRHFAEGFQSDLWVRVSQRLQLKLPDHYPNDPYPLANIEAAARLLKRDASATLQ